MFTGILHHIALNFAAQKTLVISIRISPQRYVVNDLCTHVGLTYNMVLFQPLAPANGAPADATRDPLLRDKVHGAEIMDVRKALAFAGFTHKSPRAVSYVRADKAFDPQPDTYGQQETVRGRSIGRVPKDAGRGRAISM